MICPRCHRQYHDDHRFCPHDGDKLVEALDVRRIKVQPSEHFGTVVADRYQIRGMIGRGATALVYLVLDRMTNMPVVLKVLEAKQARLPKVRARFILEARAASAVAHPCIVNVLDVGLCDDGAPYIAMEYLLGEALSTYLVRSKKMEPAVGVPFMRQLADGLGAAHRAGIVHRDVKPGNIFLVGEKGDPHRLKILDFGFAKLNEFTGLTATGMAVGTIQYMAPEQAVGDPAEPRTDVYGLGVLMYRVFGGRLPFVGRDEAEVLGLHLCAEPPPLDLGQDPLARGLEAVIRRALRKHPENRYPSMDAMVDDLDHLLRPMELYANTPLEHEDVYMPKTAYSKHIAVVLRQRLETSPSSG